MNLVITDVHCAANERKNNTCFEIQKIIFKRIYRPPRTLTPDSNELVICLCRIDLHRLTAMSIHQQTGGNEKEL